MDRELDFVRNISTGQETDLHEFNFVHNSNTALSSFFYPQQMNLTKWGGTADGYVYGSGFREIDLSTGQIVFEWKSTDHVTPDETSPNANLSVVALHGMNGDGTKTLGNGTGPWDYFHINSVDVDPSGVLAYAYC